MKNSISFWTHLRYFIPLQFGFRESRSTSYALLSLAETIIKSLDDGKFGCGIFLDL